MRSRNFCLHVVDQEALDLAMKILKTRHEILSDVMILDKPEMAWEK